MNLRKLYSLVPAVFCAAWLFVPQPTLAAVDDDETYDADDALPDLSEVREHLLEEIVVVGEKARMFWEAQSELAEEDSAVSTIQPLSNRKKHQRILHEKVRALASTNPNLLKVMLRREILKRELENRKEQQQSEE